MAKKNDNGLYLPLRVDLDAWEASLAALDGPLLEKMRMLRSEMKDLTMEYDVKISNAKAAGDNLKAIQLEMQKLTEMEKLQTATVQGLSQAYQKSVASTGQYSKQSKELLKNLQAQQLALNKTRIALDNMQGSLGGSLVSALRSASPEFARFADLANAAAVNLAKIAPASKLSIAAMGKIGLAVGALVLAGKGMASVANSVSEVAEAAGKANEPIYQLREELNTSYEEAEKLHGIMQMDGIAGETFAQTINKLNKQLLKAGENGNLASDMLTRFGAELRNQDGSRKSTIEQLQELSAAYQRAASVGAGRDFLTATGTTPLVHILADLDGYTERWERIRVEYQKNYDASHLLLEMNNHLIESERQLATVKGEVFTEQALKNKENEIRANVAEAEIIKANADTYKEYGKILGDIADNFTKIKLVASVAWTKIVTDAKGLTTELKPVGDALTAIEKKLEKIAKYHPVGWAIGKLKEYWQDASAEVDKYYKKAEQVDVKPKKDFKERDPEAEREAAKQAAAAEKKQADAQLKLSRELQAAKQTDYEKDVQRIADERDEYIKAGADKLQADELYAIKKAQIDAKYAEKASGKQDVEKAKQAQLQITSVFQTETERRIAEINRQRDAWIKAGASEVEATRAAQAQIREARMSEAERTLQQRAKLIKRAQIEQQKGGDWEGRLKSWADDEYIRGLGVNRKDIAWAQRYGFDKINELGNARDRVLGSIVGGGSTVNAPVTINMDNTVVENESAMVSLANRVAAVMLPTIQQALGNAGFVENGYAR